jgi:glycosyltransferase involved in cell wall biosynthesis
MIINIISSSVGGGAELIVGELHKLYRQQSIDSRIVYFSGEKSTFDDNSVIVFGTNPRNPANIFHVRKTLKKFTDNKSNKIIVHAHLTWPFFYVSLAAIGLKNVKLIYTEHSTNNKRRNIPFFWVLERLIYARFNRIICISHGVEKALVKWLGPSISNNLTTIPNGSRIYSKIKRPVLDDRLPNLISIGSLTTRKNFATTIRAIELLRDEIEIYSIIGEGPERPQLEKIIKAKGLERYVKLLGWSDSIEAHLHMADIQLIPSLWEGFGLVAVEGMSTGLPVVASNVDGLREVLDQSNLSVTLVNEPESIQAWVNCIRKSIVNIKAVGLENLSSSSRNQSEKFTLNEMAKKYLNVYREVIGEDESKFN